MMSGTMKSSMSFEYYSLLDSSLCTHVINLCFCLCDLWRFGQWIPTSYHLGIWNLNLRYRGIWNLNLYNLGIWNKTWNSHVSCILAHRGPNIVEFVSSRYPNKIQDSCQISNSTRHLGSVRNKLRLRMQCYA